MKDIFDGSYSLSEDINYALAHNGLSNGKEILAIVFNDSNTKCRVAYIPSDPEKENKLYFSGDKSIDFDMIKYLPLPQGLSTESILTKFNNIKDHTFQEAMSKVDHDSIIEARKNILKNRPLIEKINSAFRRSLRPVDTQLDDTQLDDANMEIFNHCNTRQEEIVLLVSDIDYALANNMEDPKKNIILIVHPNYENNIRFGYYQDSDNIVHFSDGTETHPSKNSFLLPDFDTHTLVQCFKKIDDDLYIEVGKSLDYSQIYYKAQEIKLAKPLSQKFKDAFQI